MVRLLAFKGHSSVKSALASGAVSVLQLAWRRCSDSTAFCCLKDVSAVMRRTSKIDGVVGVCGGRGEVVR